jgi:hypothetical protein
MFWYAKFVPRVHPRLSVNPVHNPYFGYTVNATNLAVGSGLQVFFLIFSTPREEKE